MHAGFGTGGVDGVREDSASLDSSIDIRILNVGSQCRTPKPSMPSVREGQHRWQGGGQPRRRPAAGVLIQGCFTVELTTVNDHQNNSHPLSES